MKVSNFKFVDANNDVVNINLDKELDYDKAVTIMSYIFNYDKYDKDQYFRKNLDATEEEISMVEDSIKRVIDLDTMVKKEEIKYPNNEAHKYINPDKSLLNNLKSKLDYLTEEDNLDQSLNNSDDDYMDDYMDEDEGDMGYKCADLTENCIENSYYYLIDDLKDKGYKNIYISGPIRNLGYDVAKRSFRSFAKILESEGFNVDHTFTTLYPNNRSKEYYIKNGIIRMMQCDAVVRFNSQVVSEGANIEKDVAKIINIPYYEVNVACIVM